jgi:cytochrome oxidase Cu insertion factor (SCO1/SenC/PrrC family)
MASRILIACAVLLVCGTLTASLTAQEQESSATEKPQDSTQQVAPRQPLEWTERYDQLFRERSPIVGDYAPDVSAWDEYGNEFELSATSGKYTVLVFGCLT